MYAHRFLSGGVVAAHVQLQRAVHTVQLAPATLRTFVSLSALYAERRGLSMTSGSRTLLLGVICCAARRSTQHFLTSPLPSHGWQPFSAVQPRATELRPTPPVVRVHTFKAQDICHTLIACLDTNIILAINSSLPSIATLPNFDTPQLNPASHKY